MKILTRLFLLCPLLLSFSVMAEDEPYVPYIPLEVPVQHIKMSNDGTGVVQKVSCKGCDFKIVNITADTKAFVNNTETDRRNVRTNKHRMVLVKFSRETGDVLELRWFE